MANPRKRKLRSRNGWLGLAGNGFAIHATERWQRVDQERDRFEDEAADRQGGVVIDSDSVIRLSSVAENLGGLFPDLENSVGNGSLRPSTSPVLPS